MVGIFLAFMGIGFGNGMLETYMIDFVKATQAEVGNAFIIRAIGYTSTSLALGLVRIVVIIS